MYLSTFLNHVRAVRSWAEKHAAQATIEVDSFQMEVKTPHCYFTLFPQFRERRGDHLVNGSQLTEDTAGFLGWLPYPPLQWDLSLEKLHFKAYAARHGLRTFCAATPIGAQQRAPDLEGHAFADEPIQGTHLKFWVWGNTVFHAQAQPSATAVGDAHSPHMTQGADNCLASLPRTWLQQATTAAGILGRDVAERFKSPILYTLEGVADAHGELWWLEVDANPPFPPTGYPHVFATLFGTRPDE